MHKNTNKSYFLVAFTAPFIVSDRLFMTELRRGTFGRQRKPLTINVVLLDEDDLIFSSRSCDENNDCQPCSLGETLENSVRIPR